MNRRTWAALTCLPLLACGGGSGADAVLAPAPAPAPAPSDVPAGHVLVWSDEFNGNGLPDASHWDDDTDRNRDGWFNNERQYYSRARAENAVVGNGRLRITARLEELRSAADWGGQRYTSARLVTRGKAEWTYGFFEVRAKLPCGRGTWPAIWTLGSSGVWPDAGEIDIMEQVGSNPSRVFGTVHTLQSGGTGTGAAVQVPDACSAFHNYQLHWTADAIVIGIDGAEIYRYTNPRRGTSTWPFDAPQYLLLNLAIGGDLGGSIDDAIFPVAMEIDHVRVYQAVR
jgi:beta-glucanase (GH16 family)